MKIATLNDLTFQKSQFLQSIACTPEYATLFHSFFGRGLVVKTAIAERLVSSAASCRLSRFSHIPFELLQEFINRDFLVLSELPERETVLGQFMNDSSKSVKALSVTAATTCNFDCYHCIHFAAKHLDDRKAKPDKMPFDTCRIAIDWIAGWLLKQGRTQMAISFGGGEPLLNWPVINNILQYVNEKYGSLLKMDLSINTNASLITRNIAGILKKNGVHIVTSLDGTREGNNHARKMKSGGSSFDHILKAFNVLSSFDMPVRAVHIMLNANNFEDLDDSFIELLSRRGIISMTVEPDLTDRLPQSVGVLVEKMMTFRRSARKKGISVTGYWERPFEKIIQKKKNIKTHFCYAMGGETLDLLPDGSIYGCSYTDKKLGHIEAFAADGSTDALIRSPAYRAMVASRRAGHIAWCSGCELEGVCGGGCYVTEAHAAQKNDKALVEYRCNFYREITKQLLIDAVEQILLKPKEGAAGFR